MKYCDVCGTLNPRENNFCIHCGNKLISEHFCPYCGELNLDYATVCVKCGMQINPMVIDDFDTFFSEYNAELLSHAQISDEEYMILLSNIFKRAEYFEIDGNNIKNKILTFASAFAECETKSRGYERGSIYLGNKICYDDRLDDSVQISTIIHELAHYLLFLIVDSLLCKILKVNTSSTIQSFIWYFLTLPEFKIMNEYCAHTVEGRFIPYGYQNYGSFNLLVERLNVDEESLKGMVVFGNTFANEIIIFLEKFIDEDLRDEIKIQYRKDSIPPTYKSILRETTDSLPLTIKNLTLMRILFDIFKEASNEDVRNELEEIKKEIELNY